MIYRRDGKGMEEAAYETGPDDRDFINPAAKRQGDSAVSGGKV